MMGLAAPYILLSDEPVDDLPDYLTEDAEVARATVREWWSVENAQDCHDTLTRLSEARMSGDYDVVAPLANRALDFPAGHEIETAHVDFLADLERANGLRPERFTTPYRHWVTALRNPDFRRHLPETLPMADFGWDLMRTGSFGRAAVQAEYLTPTELGGYLSTALQNIQALAPNWRAYAASYLTGRAFWNVDSSIGDALEGAAMMADVIRRSLADPDSPWVQVSLHPDG